MAWCLPRLSITTVFSAADQSWNSEMIYDLIGTLGLHDWLPGSQQFHIPEFELEREYNIIEKWPTWNIVHFSRIAEWMIKRESLPTQNREQYVASVTKCLFSAN